MNQINETDDTINDDRRTVVKSMGAFAALGAIHFPFKGLFGSTVNGVQSGEHVLTLTSPYGSILYYQFQVSGSVRKLDHDPHGNVPAKAVTVDGEDDLKGCLVHGASNGGADVYAVTGNLVYATMSGPGASSDARVFENGADITSSFARGSAPSSATDTDCALEPTTTVEPASEIVCDATNATSDVELTIQVTEQVYQAGEAYDGLTFIVNAGERATIGFDGALLCFAVQGGDADVAIRYRET